MKRWIALLLAVLMLFSLVGCKKTQSNDEDYTAPLTAVGTYEPGNADFYVLQDKFYDYFLGLLGYGFITVQNNEGKFEESQLIKFALVQLSYAGDDPDEGVKKSQIDRVTRRYFSQKTEKLENTTLLTYDETEKLYYPNNMEYTNGQFMILKSLTVNENGLCNALFDRIKPQDDIFAEKSEEEIKTQLLNGDYTDVGEVQSIELTFRERDTAAFGYYIQTITLKEINDPAV